MQTGLLLTQEKNLQFLVRHIWNYQCYLMDSVDDFFFPLTFSSIMKKKVLSPITLQAIKRL